MPLYKVTYMNSGGSECTTRIVADNEELAEQNIRVAGYFPIKTERTTELLSPEAGENVGFFTSLWRAIREFFTAGREL